MLQKEIENDRKNKSRGQPLPFACAVSSFLIGQREPRPRLGSNLMCFGGAYHFEVLSMSFFLLNVV